MANYENTQSNGSQSSTEDGGFGHRVDQIGSDAAHLWGNARSAVTDLGQTLDLKGRVDRHPYGMMAAALGVAAEFVAPTYTGYGTTTLDAHRRRRTRMAQRRDSQRVSASLA